MPAGARGKPPLPRGRKLILWFSGDESPAKQAPASTPRLRRWPLHPCFPDRLVINAEEAERVRAIFELYLQRQGLRAVAEELQQRGQLQQLSSEWNACNAGKRLPEDVEPAHDAQNRQNTRINVK